MLRKINRIHEFGVFNRFSWDSTVRDKGNNIGHFKKLNIIYGRNYSGKTTLSRIIRCFEVGTLHDKYLSSQFEIDHTEEGILDQEKLIDHSFDVRVYNEDFVKDNLKFLIDEQKHIEPFAIIGENNVELESSIKEKEDLLGSEADKIGLKYESKIKREEYEKKVTESNSIKNDLDDKLRNKANNVIKRNPLYNDVTYNINDIKRDIDYLNKNPRSPLEDEQVTALKELLKEEPKLIISSLSVFSPSFKTIFEKSRDLLSTSINPSAPIQELLNDAILELWVRSGIEHHRGKREICGFCGQKLPYNLWNKLDAHFNKESEDIREAISNHIVTIKQEKDYLNSLLSFKKEQYYSPLKRKIDRLEDDWNIEVKKYNENLDYLLSELNGRLKNIFKSIELKEIDDNTKFLEKLQKEINAWRGMY